MTALKIMDLHKSFGNHKIINGLSLTVPEKTILGFLGKNGAGKTTTMKMILGFLKIDKGNIEVFGENVRYGSANTNKYIGYLPDVPEFYGYMTPKEYLSLCGSITGLSNQEIKVKSVELLELVGLDEYDKKIQGFSRGMKQRLGIAQALLNNPKLLICDEPTSALDPIGRKEILDIIRKIKNTTTVIFSTHILSDVESICDNVMILDEGKNVLEGSIDNIKRLKRTNEIKIKFNSIEELHKFKNIGNIPKMKMRIEENILYLTGDISSEFGKHILFKMYQANIFPLELMMKEPTLEDIFMEAIKV